MPQIEAGTHDNTPVTRWHLTDDSGEVRVVALWREHASKRAPLDSPVKITNLKVTDTKGVRFYNSTGLTDVEEVSLLIFLSNKPFLYNQYSMTWTPLRK